MGTKKPCPPYTRVLGGETGKVPVADIEETIISDLQSGVPVSLERALLVLSGLKTDREISSYEQKIGEIFSRFLDKHPEACKSGAGYPPPYFHESIAASLFDYLWTSKPKRFDERFLLADAVDAQLDPDVNRAVGNCVGLTSLYSVLGVRAGLGLSVLSNTDHLLGRLRLGKRTIDIDHTDPLGFGCDVGDGFREFPLTSLIANVLNSRGLHREKEGDRAGAASDYNKAVLANPDYANARNNRGNSMFWINDFEAAAADYSEATRIEPRFCEAWFNRGMANQRLGRLDEARGDYNAALKINPDFTDSLKCLEFLDGGDGPEPVFKPPQSSGGQ